MKFKVKNEYRSINKDIIINPKNNEIGILIQYINIEGYYQETIDKSIQINSPTNTFQGWKSRYEDLFGENTQTGTLDEKLYVISDEGHQSGLFGVNSKDIDEVMEKLEFNQGLFY